MIRALVWKEWRETAVVWAGLLGALAFVSFLYWRQPHGDDDRELALAFFLASAAAVLGLVQASSDTPGGTRDLLLHRPLRRAHLLAAKLLSGLVPLLALAGLALRPPTRPHGAWTVPATGLATLAVGAVYTACFCGAWQRDRGRLVRLCVPLGGGLTAALIAGWSIVGGHWAVGLLALLAIHLLLLVSLTIDLHVRGDRRWPQVLLPRLAFALLIGVGATVVAIAFGVPGSWVGAPLCWVVRAAVDPALSPAAPLLAAVLVCFFARRAQARQRRYYQPHTLAWTLFVLAGGPSGWLAHHLSRRWPALLPCPACGRVVPRDRDHCACCAAPFPGAAHTDCEILAPHGAGGA